LNERGIEKKMMKWKRTYCVTKLKILDRIGEGSEGGITWSQKFSEKIEKILGRKIILRPIGRPKIKK